MIALTKKGLLAHQTTRNKSLTIENLTSIGKTITDKMYTSNGELVLVASSPDQDCVYKELANTQRREVIVYLQKHYNNVSQYKTIFGSRGRFLTMLDQPINLKIQEEVEVVLPC